MLTASPLLETIALIEGAGPETLGVQCDVFSAEDVADL